MWEQGQVPQKEYRDIVQPRREAVEAKHQLGLNLARDVKGSRDFHSIWIVEERLGKWKVLLNGAKSLGTKDTEKAEIVGFFALVFSSEIYFQEMLCVHALSQRQ